MIIAKTLLEGGSLSKKGTGILIQTLYLFAIRPIANQRVKRGKAKKKKKNNNESSHPLRGLGRPNQQKIGAVSHPMKKERV
jgi:hypothetical protein